MLNDLEKEELLTDARNALRAAAFRKARTFLEKVGGLDTYLTFLDRIQKVSPLSPRGVRRAVGKYRL